MTIHTEAGQGEHDASQPAPVGEPTAILLYGGTGDLARRLVLPAIYALFVRGLLPTRFALVGVGRGDVSGDAFRAPAPAALTESADPPAQEQFDQFASHVRFAGGGFRDTDPGTLLDVVDSVRNDLGAEVRLVHYLSLPPVAFAPTTRAIHAHGLNTADSTVVYEKPYGTSLDSFHALDELVHSVFDEEQIFRIDHFLGKEATQNLYLTRFANRLFGDVWNRRHIAQVQIDVPETLDVADRADFYDATGALLDMLITHLFQVAAEVAMEPPLSIAPEDVQAAREAVLAAFRPLDPADVVLGQYSSYLETDGVADGSRTDTFAAARLWVDTDRWRGVPFVLRTGKMMPQSAQKVSLIFRPADGPLGNFAPAANAIVYDLKGDGAIDVRLTVKKPGPDPVPAESATSLLLSNVAPGSMTPYTSLIHDVLTGNRMLFTTSAGLQSAFTAFQPMLTDARPDVETYPDGSWGPGSADRLTDGLGWILGDGSPT